MPLDIGPIGPDDLPEFVRAEHLAFGSWATEEMVEDVRLVAELDRTLAGRDQGRIVATAAAGSWELTVPGGAVPAAAVTAVGVAPTHRRQGALRALMDHQLDDVAGRGEPVAVLLASESAIYGRFGYGPATMTARWELDADRSAFAVPAEVGGRFQVLGAEAVADRLPAVYDAARGRHPGRLARPPGWFAMVGLDRPRDRDGGSALFAVLHEAPDGAADGYVTYRVHDDWSTGIPQHTLVAADHAAVDDAVAAALWRFCCDIDLVRTVRCVDAPVDDPLRWRLADPRQLRASQLGDALWVRVLDPTAAFSARRHPVEGELVVEVTDALRPEVAGRWRLEGGPDGAGCQRSSAGADLAMGAAELGAVYLGATRPSTLAGAGRVAELRPGALARADAFLSWSPAAWCGTDF